MILSLGWKEYREQSTVWVAVAALAVLVLVGLTFSLAPQGLESASPDNVTLIVLAAVGLVITYGLVCGAMMLAGEEEGGTLPFLDTLPALRRHVWAGKLLAGLALTLLQGALLGGVMAVLGLQGAVSWGAPRSAFLGWQWLLVLPAVALEAYCWGLLGSAVCRQVLPAVVLSAVFLVVPWLLVTPPSWEEQPVALLVRVGLAAAALVVSALVFTRPDRQRSTLGGIRTRGRSGPGSGHAHPHPTPGKVLVWLAARQGGVWLLLLGVAGFLLALVLAGYGPIYWPVLTLLVGVACGSSVYLGEQSQGTYRFLGEQRLPLNRVWLWKTGSWLAAAVLLAVLVFVGGAVHLAIASTPGGGGPADQGAWALFQGGVRWGRLLSPVTVFGLWVLHGFSIAQACSLVWRKSAAALFMALVLSAAAGAVWLPSLVAGGLPAWQVFAPPLLLLAAGRLVMRPWVSDRLHTWQPLAGLTLCGVLAVAWVAGCLGGRVAAVSDLDEPGETNNFAQTVRTFEARLPKPEQNEAGALLRQALARLKDEESQTSAALGAPNRGGVGGGPLAPGRGTPRTPDGDYHEQVEQVVQRGWNGPTPDLDTWLDVLFAGDWAGQLRQAAAGPPGMVEDPRRADWFRSPDALHQSQWAGLLFTARALQLQARGDDREALGHLATVLGLSRQLRHLGTGNFWLTGVAVERTALDGLDRWVERVSPRPELLRQALAELTRHEQALPPASDGVLADYVSCRNTLDDAGVLLRWYDCGGDALPQRLNGTVLVAAWEAPWEKARAERLVSAVFAGRLRAVEAGYPLLATQRRAHEGSGPPRSMGRLALEDWLAGDTGPEGARTRARLDSLLEESWVGDLLCRLTSLPLLEAGSLCRVRGHRLTLALALYQAEKGRPAAVLDDLVTGGVLAEVPRDPFSPTQQGFLYRVSEGEDISWDAQAEEGRQTRHVAAGQGVVWSIGTDLTNDGGLVQGATLSPAAQRFPGRRSDWIFVVSRWR